MNDDAPTVTPHDSVLWGINPKTRKMQKIMTGTFAECKAAERTRTSKGWKAMTLPKSDTPACHDLLGAAKMALHELDEAVRRNEISDIEWTHVIAPLRDAIADAQKPA